MTDYHIESLYFSNTKNLTYQNVLVDILSTMNPNRLFFYSLRQVFGKIYKYNALNILFAYQKYF